MTGDVSAALAAFNEVKRAVSVLREEYDDVCRQIVEAETLLKTLPSKFLPLEDFKAAILDYVDARGAAYAKKEVRGYLALFSTHGMNGLATPVSLYGVPLNYGEMEAASSGCGDPMHAQFLTGNGNEYKQDFAFYYFFGGLVRSGLESVMKEMSPSDFGYDRVRSDQIGSDRATRRKELEELNEKIRLLTPRKEKIAAQLLELGVKVGK